MMEATAYWRGRAKTYGAEHPSGPSWVEHYWNSWRMPHRLALRDALATLDDLTVHSMLEVGCNVGPNLRLWRERWPLRVLMGCDVSPEAVAAAQRYFADDVSTYFWRDDVMTSAWFPMADVVVTCYTLPYTPPTMIDEVLLKLWASARVAVVLAEPQGDPDCEMIELAPPTFRYDYARRLRVLGAEVAPLTTVSPEADQLNAILIARRGR